MEPQLPAGSKPIRRVLVVDDNEDMLASMKILLVRAGYEVEVASNGARAVRLQRERPAHVLITDIFMPDKNGIELIHQFKEEFPEVRIIAMSGGGELVKRDYLGRSGLFGADSILRKPFDPEALRQALHRVLSP